MDQRESDYRIVVLETKMDEIYRRLDKFDGKLDTIGIDIANIKNLASTGKGGLRAMLWAGGAILSIIAAIAGWGTFLGLDK